jgi:hypothetical protein
LDWTFAPSPPAPPTPLILCPLQQAADSMHYDYAIGVSTSAQIFAMVYVSLSA